MFALESTLLVLGLLTASFSRAAPVAQTTAAGVIYTLHNVQNASIVAMSVSENGTIYGTGVSTPTGGKGSSATVGTGQPNVGALFSSDAVVAEDNYLFAVNAGSNSVSMFAIDPFNPLHPTLVGKPADTLGEFPVSLAYSSSLSMLCALNGGAKAGVTCFNVDPTAGLSTTDKAPRSIKQGLNQTTPPSGPFSTASDIKFNPSSSALLVSTKGSPSTKPISSGYLFAWPVVSGKVGTTPVVNKLSALVLDFSLTFTGSDFDLFITDPAVGGDFLSVSSQLDIAVQQTVNITYQKAACWSYYDPTSSTVFVTDAAQTNVTALSAIDGSIMSTINYSPSVGGGQDMIKLGNSLYIISSTGPVVNINLVGFSTQTAAAQVQTFDPLPASMLSADQISGIAAWASSSVSASR